ncbi:MAG TPA: hypothetical protein VD766_06365 [Solirubrobacterales bacterium]|nr:hypothetical protein [Solirubrobacterales bacterium]
MAAPRPDEVYRGATRVMAVVILFFGLLIVGLTIARGGGIAAVGLWIGLVFCGLGAGRLYISYRT